MCIHTYIHTYIHTRVLNLCASKRCSSAPGVHLYQPVFHNCAEVSKISGTSDCHCTIHPNTTPYHTIPYHTIPYHPTSYIIHTSSQYCVHLAKYSNAWLIRHGQKNCRLIFGVKNETMVSVIHIGVFHLMYTVKIAQSCCQQLAWSCTPYWVTFVMIDLTDGLRDVCVYDVWCGMPYHTIPWHTIPWHTIPYHTISYHALQYYTIPYHTIPYHTIHHTHKCPSNHLSNHPLKR